MKNFADFKRRLKTAQETAENINFTRIVRRQYIDGQATETTEGPTPSKIKRVQSSAKTVFFFFD